MPLDAVNLLLGDPGVTGGTVPLAPNPGDPGEPGGTLEGGGPLADGPREGGGGDVSTVGALGLFLGDGLA